MRRLFALTLALFFALSPLAHAVSRTATFGDQNSSNVYRMIATSDGIITFASDTGIKYPFEVATTSDTLTAAETGKVIVVNSTTQAEFELPAAVVGMVFTFTSATNVIFAVDPDGTDTIVHAFSSIPLDAGDKILSSGATSDSITLFSAAASTWYVTDINGGTFTDGGQ